MLSALPIPLHPIFLNFLIFFLIPAPLSFQQPPPCGAGSC